MVDKLGNRGRANWKSKEQRGQQLFFLLSSSLTLLLPDPLHQLAASLGVGLQDRVVCSLQPNAIVVWPTERRHNPAQSLSSEFDLQQLKCANQHFRLCSLRLEGPCSTCNIRLMEGVLFTTALLDPLQVAHVTYDCAEASPQLSKN
jgi:hypothetical protein